MKYQPKMNWAKVKPVINNDVRMLCFRSYLDHPKGCPNFGKRETCPPKAPIFEDICCIHDVFVIWNEFDLYGHVRNLRNKHPNWSKRQLYCCLYWQGKARKQLKYHIDHFKMNHSGYRITTTPEAEGIDITATMYKLGIFLEWMPKTIAYQVAIAGKRLNEIST